MTCVVTPLETANVLDVRGKVNMTNMKHENDVEIITF